jgi:Fuc2NAc and GlcNAc transferase
MIFLLSGIFIISLGMTYGVRHYALIKNVMDIPNHRSSHTIPTPRGGGVAFIVGFFLGLPFLLYAHKIPLSIFSAFLSAGALIALLGFLDDHAPIPAKWRILGHLLASALILIFLMGMPNLNFFSWTFSLTFANILGAVFLVWLINLCNFMDGIDGLAGIEAITVCLGGALLFWLTGHHSLVILPLVLLASVAGFLFWNFPPARIFMGDAGSGFLGVVFGIFALQAGHVKQQLFWSWLILLGVFIVDATVTLLRRAISGEKIYEAHRSHAYQHASRIFKSHFQVTMAVFLINVLWLLPIALLVGLDYLKEEIGLLIAYLPLIMLSIQFQAGKPD